MKTYFIPGDGEINVTRSRQSIPGDGYWGQASDPEPEGEAKEATEEAEKADEDSPEV